jgi:glutamyl-tRNA reductase
VTLVLLGANYNDIPLSELENLERHTDSIRSKLFSISKEESGINGGVAIGTCNRFEVYLDTDRFHSAVENAIGVVAEVTGLSQDYCSKLLRVSYGSAAVQHLYSVTSGLESMIVGEGEIAGQVKRGLQVAQSEAHTSREIEKLFQSAAQVAKKVSTETGLGEAGRSVFTAALTLHKEKFGSIEGNTVTVMGTGAYARVVVAALQREGVGQIYVYSSSGRAQEFSDGRGTTPVAKTDLARTLAASDFAVTASGGSGHMIDLKLARSVVELRDSEFRIIDVALSADVAPPVYDMAGVSIMDLDYIRLHTPSEHSEAILRAQEIVRHQVSEFENEAIARAADPMVVAMREHIAQLIQEEVERVRSKSGDEMAEEVHRSLKRVTSTFMHVPTLAAKTSAKEGNEKQFIDALRMVFGIEVNRVADA